MNYSIITLCIICFVGIFALNFYFRVKVFKYYKVLIDNRVDFKTVHIFDAKRLEREVLPRYPNQKEAILGFTQGIRRSVRLAGILISVSLIALCVLMFGIG